jgi:hypothetical protein
MSIGAICKRAFIMSSLPIPVLKATRRQIRVLTVDEHQLVQEGLAAMINREEDMTVVATASSGEEAIGAGAASEQEASLA